MDRRRSLLAAETVEAAATFADWDDSELHVVNVIPSFKYYVLALNAGLSAVDANNLEAEARQQRTICQFLERLDVDRVSETAVRQRVLIRKEAIIGAKTDAGVTLHGFGQDERSQSRRRNRGDRFLEEQPHMSSATGAGSFEGSRHTKRTAALEKCSRRFLPSVLIEIDGPEETCLILKHGINVRNERLPSRIES